MTIPHSPNDPTRTPSGFQRLMTTERAVDTLRRRIVYLRCVLERREPVLNQPMLLIRGEIGAMRTALHAMGVGVEDLPQMPPPFVPSPQP